MGTQCGVHIQDSLAKLADSPNGVGVDGRGGLGTIRRVLRMAMSIAWMPPGAEQIMVLPSGCVGVAVEVAAGEAGLISEAPVFQGMSADRK